MDWRERLAAYLGAQLPSAERVDIVNVRGMPAGASNDTVSFDARVTLEGKVFELPLVLRPERPDGILAPYDVGRQFRVMRALSATAVPVPAVAWHEASAEVLGVPFFVMERVTGETLWHSGETRGFRNVILRYPERKLSVIVLTNRNDPEPYMTAKAIADLYLPGTRRP